MTKKVTSVILLLTTFLLGIWLARSYYKPTAPIINTDSTILLNRVRQVCKLVTIEGDVNVMYDQENIRKVKVYLPIPTNFNFSKKASVEVQGKVLVGYDLENVTFDVDSSSMTIIVKNLPEPEILSIEHDVKYRNFEESFFNEFDAKDISEMNTKAKEILREKAIEDNLLKQAENQGKDMLNVIEFMIKGAGWKVEFERRLFEDMTLQDSTILKN